MAHGTASYTPRTLDVLEAVRDNNDRVAVLRSSSAPEFNGVWWGNERVSVDARWLEDDGLIVRDGSGFSITAAGEAVLVEAGR